jgi:hypothetical protein
MFLNNRGRKKRGGKEASKKQQQEGPFVCRTATRGKQKAARLLNKMNRKKEM